MLSREQFGTEFPEFSLHICHRLGTIEVRHPQEPTGADTKMLNINVLSIKGQGRHTTVPFQANSTEKTVPPSSKC